MGSLFSSSEQTLPPPHSPILKTAWREVTWDNETDLQYVKAFRLQKEEVRNIRVLFYGPVGAGKTSFIGSVKNILRGKMSGLALANAMENVDTSFTKRYETHQIKKDKDNFYPFVFTDLVGLQGGNGVMVEDIKMAMMGQVKEGYKFNPKSPLTTEDSFYNPTPSPEDRAHVLVCVYSANVPEMNENILQKMKAIREAASNLGIPQLAIITKIDEACAEIAKDLKNVYKSKYLKEKMVDFSKKLGIPLNCILPVKNYSEEIKLDNEVNTMILSALRLMLDFGEEFIDNIL